MNPHGEAARSEPPWKKRITLAEINGRRVNEAIERGEGKTGPTVFVCECGHIGCNATVELEIAEYENVRADFDRFFVVPGHEIVEVDRVVERHPEHLVVVKPDEGARESAREADERTS